MSVGESKTSKNGGVSEFLGLLSSVSGEVAAREASLDRKGSLGLIGGMGILELLVALQVGRLEKCTAEADEEQLRDEAMGIRRQLAIEILPLEEQGDETTMVLVCRYRTIHTRFSAPDPLRWVGSGREIDMDLSFLIKFFCLRLRNKLLLTFLLKSTNFSLPKFLKKRTMFFFVLFS